jgi:hypothetical protein
MQLHLTEKERDELMALLRGTLTEMPMEILDTDNHDWRRQLHVREEVLHGVLDRLQDSESRAELR